MPDGAGAAVVSPSSSAKLFTKDAITTHNNAEQTASSQTAAHFFWLKELYQCAVPRLTLCNPRGDPRAPVSNARKTLDMSQVNTAFRLPFVRLLPA